MRTVHRDGVVVTFLALAVIVGLTDLAFATAPAKRKVVKSYYLSLGDSWAEGYQPGSLNGVETLHGYSNRVVTDLAPKRRLTLENFGCGGVTSQQLIGAAGCPTGHQAINGYVYSTTSQLGSALNFIKVHFGHIGLISIAIGGNDFDQGMSLSTTTSNIATIAGDLRRAVGPSVPIVGLGFDDPVLSSWLSGPSGQTSAQSSVSYYMGTINPALSQAYATSNVAFVDIGKAFGTYVPLNQMVSFDPYGQIPYAVAQICALTWSCQGGDEHPNVAGYSLMAREIARTVTTLPRQGLHGWSPVGSPAAISSP